MNIAVGFLIITSSRSFEHLQWLELEKENGIFFTLPEWIFLAEHMTGPHE